MWSEFLGKEATLTEARRFAGTTRVDGSNVAQWLRRPENKWQDLSAGVRSRFSGETWARIETDLRYEGYIRRQEETVVRAKSMEEAPIPLGLDFAAIAGLRTEARQKLAAVAPLSLGQAGRISGVTPADVALLSVWVQRQTSRDRDHISAT